MLELLHNQPNNSVMNLMHTRSIFALTVIIWLLMILATACGASGFGSYSPTPTPPAGIYSVVEVWSKLSQNTNTESDNAIVEVWNILHQDFVEKNDLDSHSIGQVAIDAMLDYQNISIDTANSDVLGEVAIEAMLGSLGDPYTLFMDQDEYELYTQNIQGKFEGIGARVDIVNSRITIIQPLPNSPAERAGIQAGDVILEVDGTSTQGWSLMESVINIRGPEGSSVHLLVQHHDVADPILIEIVRSEIKVESISWEMLPGSIAYVKISTFAENTDEILEETLGNLEGISGIILDLRNNFGGLLSTTLNIANEFIDDELVLYSVDGDGQRTDHKVKSDGLAQNIPMVVLVNRASASASEVLSGALQDHERAILIGSTTFGKGSVNLHKPLNNGSGLIFTTAHWYSPNGRLIEGHGLDPDIWIEQSSDNNNEDPHLEKAIEHMHTQANRFS